MKEFGIDLVIKTMWNLGMIGVTVTALLKPYYQRSCQPSPTFCSFVFSAPQPVERW